MANHASALKRARQSEERRLLNKAYKTRARNAVKEARSAIETGAADKAQESFRQAVSVIQMTAGMGVIHRNKAARKISRLARDLSRLPTA